MAVSEVGLAFFPTLMPDFPQWNYTAHYYEYEKVLEDIDQVGHDRPAMFFLGDSGVRGAEVQRGYEWISLLQEAIPQYEMVNMGFGGSSQVEQWVIFKHYVLSSKAKVNWVFLDVTEGDIDSENLAHREIFLEGGEAPFLSRLGRQFENNKRFGRYRRFLDRYSCFYRLMKYAMFGTSNYLEKPEDIVKEMIQTGETFVPKNIFLQPGETVEGASRQLSSKALTATYEYLDKFKNYAKGSGVKLGLIYFATKTDIYRDFQGGPPLRPAKRPVTEALVKLREYAKKSNLPLFELTDKIKEQRLETDLFLPYDPHFGTLGHRIAAKEFSRFLQALLRDVY